ncbi:MAG: hypothetical protein NW206_10855 [Hyphomonadaceae bacterium]|nr:hypothetical protein [Hyphomonadaceae bacterium]
MKTWSALAAAAALSACATHESVLDLQRPAPAARALLIFPENQQFRDSVVLEFVDGVSRYSYVFAEPNGSIMAAAINTALADSGLKAGTPTRARYGLRVHVSETNGPMAGADFHANLRATYVLVDRHTGVELFRHEASSSAETIFLGLNEGDLRTASQRSWRFVRPLAAAGAIPAASDIAAGELDPEYEEWTQADWNDFWQVYSQSLAAGALIGPVTVGAEFINPWNFLPWADDGAAAERRNGPRQSRIGSDRAADANYRTVVANVTAFMLAFSQAQGVEPMPILPCHGGPDVEALKVALQSRGHEYRTDDCSYRR